MNDGLDGEPAKRAFQYIQKRWEQKDPVVGIYCGFAPFEVIQAMGLVPAVLCAFSQQTIKTAEAVLPANLCPLIKSSYGFILEGTCPFFGLSQAVVAETTCDGKKKMFELISDIKPMFVMDLPQLPDQPEAHTHWQAMVRKLQRFLEDQFGRQATDEQISAAIRGTNRKNRLMRQIFQYAMRKPAVLNWKEIYDVGFLALIAKTEDIEPLLESLLIEAGRAGRRRLLLWKTGFAPRPGHRLPDWRGRHQDLQHHRRGGRHRGGPRCLHGYQGLHERLQ